MLENKSLESIMSKPVFTLEQNTNLAEIKNNFRVHNVHHLPVMDSSKILGIVTTQDVHVAEIINSKIDSNFDETNIRAIDIMSNKVIAIKNSATVQDAASYFVEHRVHCLPVVDDSENLVGIVTTHDLMKLISAK